MKWEYGHFSDIIFRSTNYCLESNLFQDNGANKANNVQKRFLIGSFVFWWKSHSFVSKRCGGFIYASMTVFD